MPDFLFDRRVRLVVAAPLAEDFKTLSGQVTEITDLRVQFKVEKNLEKDPNTAEIKVYNLAERTRAALQAKGCKVVLQAGYDISLATLFIGDARTIDHTHEGPDWITKIEAGDGERAYLNGRVNESFKGGVKVPEVVSRIASAVGIDPGNSLSKLTATQGQQYVHGYAAFGKASKELDKVLKASGYDWSIQDGRLQILGKRETNTERIISLSSDTGLIGTPEYGTSDKSKKPPVLKFKALLSAEIRPGGRLDFDSITHKGVHRVKKITHTGDTAGQEWYTEGEVEIL
jgi:hypothetical protein